MILGILQARVSSTRLPGKVLAPVLGKPMLARQLERVRRASTLDSVIVATSIEASDDPIDALCAEEGVHCHRGSLDDVLDRFWGAAQQYEPDHVVRLTGDCPLADREVIDDVVRLHLSGGHDYTSNVSPPTFPDGLDVEVFRIGVLEQAWRAASQVAEREHVTLWMRSHPELFSLGNLVHHPDLSALRWTVDQPEDLVFVQRVYEELYPLDAAFGMGEVLALADRRPDLRALNADIERNHWPA